MSALGGAGSQHEAAAAAPEHVNLSMRPATDARHGRLDVKIQHAQEKMARKAEWHAARLARMMAQRGDFARQPSNPTPAAPAPVAAAAAAAAAAADPTARLVGDMSLPAQSVLPPAQAVTKVWEVENPGPAAWPAGVHVVAVSGAALAVQPATAAADAVAAAAPGERVAVALDVVSPTEPGRYQQYFRLATAQGIHFGPPLCIDVVVQAPPQPPQPQPPVSVVAAAQEPVPEPVLVAPEVPAVIQPQPAPVAAVVPPVTAPVASAAAVAAAGVDAEHPLAAKVAIMHGMGFSVERAQAALVATDGQVGQAVELLLSQA